MSPRRVACYVKPAGTRASKSQVLVLCTCFGALSACDGGRPPQEAIVQDSAGIRITTSTSPSWGAAVGWSLDDSPTLSMGVLSGPDEYQFSDVVAVWQTDGGTIIVGERMASQIRIYDTDGRFERTFGREGEGPGEFRNLTALVPYRGDSIAAWDALLKRLSVFDADGALGRTQPISLGQIHGGEGPRSWGLSDSFWGSFPDGSFAFSPTMILRYDLPDLLTFRRPVIRLSAEGDSLGVLGVLVVTDLRRPDVPFPRLGTIAVHGTKIYSGQGERFELEVRAADGTPEGIIRLLGYSKPVDEMARQTFTEWYRARLSIPEMGNSEEQVERMLAGVRFPTTFPPYSALLLDTEHHLWVEEYRVDENPGPGRWQVFDSSGRWLGPVETPDDFVVHQIGADFVLGVHLPSAGVPVILKYRLIRAD